MPFQSKAQQRYMFSEHPDIAKEWAHKGPDGYIKKLPKKIRNNRDRVKAKEALSESTMEAFARRLLLGDY